jgi:hypothetical protein
MNIEHVLAIIGALVPVFSALSSFVNQIVRERQARGEEVSPMLLNGGALLNVASVNLDKAAQLAKAAKAVKAPSAAAPFEAAPAEPAPEAVKVE